LMHSAVALTSINVMDLLKSIFGQNSTAAPLSPHAQLIAYMLEALLCSA
jgi:hypothetical protein